MTAALRLNVICDEIVGL